MSRIHHLLIAVAETDRTFELTDVRGERMWVGRCIHCRRRLTVPLSGSERGSATLEHILPKNHGGGDELENLALACAACNHEKGRRIDCLRKNDPALEQMVDQLRAARTARFRR